MGCGGRVTVTIELGLLSFLTLQEIVKTKMILCANKRNKKSWNTYEMPKKKKKDDAVMHYTGVNAKSLVRSVKYCIILLPFQLTTKQGNQHCCT